MNNQERTHMELTGMTAMLVGLSAFINIVLFMLLSFRINDGVIPKLDAAVNYIEMQKNASADVGSCESYEETITFNDHETADN